MPFEKGHKHSSKPRLFEQTLRRAIAQDDGAKVRACIDKMLDLAAAGEAWAVRELADRLDGKAAQSITITDKGDAQDLSTEEILERIAAIRRGITAGTAGPQTSGDEPSSVH